MDTVQVEQKKTYSKPTLEKFGSVSAVTAGGSGNASENTSGNSRARP